MSQELHAGWIRAIDEALVVHHVGCVEDTDDYETANHKLNSLLYHSQSIGEYFAQQAVPVVDIVFDGPPGPESGRFVEVESPPGTSIRFGEWVKREDGYWVLRFNAPTTPNLACKSVQARLAEQRGYVKGDTRDPEFCENE